MPRRPSRDGAGALIERHELRVELADEHSALADRDAAVRAAEFEIVPPFVIHSSRGSVLRRSALNAGAGAIARGCA